MAKPIAAKIIFKVLTSLVESKLTNAGKINIPYHLL